VAPSGLSTLPHVRGSEGLGPKRGFGCPHEKAVGELERAALCVKNSQPGVDISRKLCKVSESMTCAHVLDQLPSCLFALNSPGTVHLLGSPLNLLAYPRRARGAFFSQFWVLRQPLTWLLSCRDPLPLPHWIPPSGLSPSSCKFR